MLTMLLQSVTVQRIISQSSLHITHTRWTLATGADVPVQGYTHVTLMIEFINPDP